MFDCVIMLLVVVLLPIIYSKLIQANDKSKHYFLDDNGPESDLVSLILSKGYIPNENYLPRPFLLKSRGNDVTYLLSKLSNEDLIKLLNEQPKKAKYEFNDILRLSLIPNSDDSQDSSKKYNIINNKTRELQSNIENESGDKKIIWPSRENSVQTPYFRLENKPVNLYSATDDRYDYGAISKLITVLNSHQLPLQKKDLSSEEGLKKEMKFDMLVAQLKKLCCKKTIHRNHSDNKFRTVNSFLPLKSGSIDSQNQPGMVEHMFLIINDDIKTNSSDDLVSVDPDSLESNSSVLLLGPITTPLTDNQLKFVMTRLSNELSKPEYLPILHELSNGSLSSRNVALMKSFVIGPDTRRYIKPHRCNHQSKLARVYGGPKWLICTGYLNLNTPSLYD